MHMLYIRIYTLKKIRDTSGCFLIQRNSHCFLKKLYTLRQKSTQIYLVVDQESHFEGKTATRLLKKNTLNT